MPKRYPVAVAVGARIRRQREEANLTRDEFAPLADIDVTQLGKYERGETDPKLTSLIRIAGAFDVDPGVFLAGLGRSLLPRAEQANLTVPEYLAQRERQGGRPSRRGRGRV